MKVANFRVKNVDELDTDDEVFNFSFTEFIKRTIAGKNYIKLEIEDIKKVFNITYDKGVLYVNRNRMRLSDSEECSRSDYKNIAHFALQEMYCICTGFVKEK